jgi:hypothetical protein
MNLKRAATQVRRQGTGGDTVLAHINPAEADYLAKHYGMSKNPHTGLPEFGLFGKLGKAFEKALIRPVGKMVRHPKQAFPLVGSVVGNMFGGPMGSIIGGGLGGAMSSKKHPLDRALGGALTGAAMSYMLPKGGEFFGVDPTSKMGSALGMQHPGFLESLGIGSKAASGASLAAKAAPMMAKPKQIAGYSAGEEELPDAGFNWKGLIDPALLGVAAAGQFLGRTKNPKGPTAEEQYESAREKRKSKEKKTKFAKPWVLRRADPEDMERRGLGYSYFEPEPEVEYEYAAHGGHMQHIGNVEGSHARGYIKGASGGQADDVETELKPGSYVMDATTVSLLGDGNSDHGAEKLQELERKFLTSGIVRNPPTSQNIRAKLSTGEYVIEPEIVNMIGKGDNNKGAKMFDTIRKNLRKQKGVKTFLPPKSKPIERYMRTR